VIVASYASKNRPRLEWTDRVFGGQLCRCGGLLPDTYSIACGHWLTCGVPCALRDRTEGQPNLNRQSVVSEEGHERILTCGLPSIEYKTKNRTSLEARFLLTRNGHATFCADAFYMKIKKIVKPLHAGPVIRGACFSEKSLEFPCGSQIACTGDGTNSQHRAVKKQHNDQDVWVCHA
jgi:hypothetical protein